MDNEFAAIVRGLPSEPEAALVVILEYIDSLNLGETDLKDDTMYVSVLRHLFNKANYHFVEFDDPTKQLKEMLGLLGSMRGQSLVQELVEKDKVLSVSSFGYAVLTPSEKKALHEHISSLRTVLEKSGLSDSKKNALYERLAALAKEIDKNGTSTDRFFAFVGDLAFAFGGATKKAKPALDEFKEILRIVVDSRERKEGKSGLAIEKSEQLALEAPREEAEGK